MIGRYRIKKLFVPDVIIDISPAEDGQVRLLYDGKDYGALLTPAAAEALLDAYRNSPILTVEYLGKAGNDTIKPGDDHQNDSIPKEPKGESIMPTTTTSKKKEPREKAAHARQPRHALALADSQAGQAISKAKEKLLICGLGVTAFIHWLRDHKITLPEARHIIQKLGFEIKDKVKPGEKAVRDNTIRPHLHCFPKFCKKKADQLPKDVVARIMKLKAETPTGAEPAKEAKPKKKAAKKAAAKKKSAKPAGKKKAASKPKAAAAAAAGDAAPAASADKLQS